MLRRLALAVAWFTWTTAILAIVVPWNGFLDHTHWGKVGWIPFISPPIKIRDIVANLLLYVPFGYLGRRSIGGRLSARSVVILAALLSFGTEATQLYSHWRFPSATDFTCNLLGTFSGIYFAQASSRAVRDTISQERQS